jgi:hypothetical protein
MPRLFRIEEAERLLPDVRTAIEAAIRLKTEFDSSRLGLAREMNRIGMLGGAMVDRGAIQGLRSGAEAKAAEVNSAIDAIHEFGCLVKDLDIGLIDFPTRFRGREVYLCWKLGEEGIAWWHGTDEGFAGRKAIDDDFRQNHEGDRVF